MAIVGWVGLELRSKEAISLKQRSRSEKIEAASLKFWNGLLRDAQTAC